MHFLLFLLVSLSAATAHAYPVRLSFDAVVTLGPDSAVGETVSGSFWFQTHGRVHLNTLLSFPGRELGYTFVAPSGNGGIRVEVDSEGFGSSPVLQSEIRNYDPTQSNRQDEFLLRARTGFSQTTLALQGSDASFFEGLGAREPTAPRFGEETPFLRYGSGYVLVEGRHGVVRLLASILPDSIRRWSIFERGPLALANSPVNTPEPSTALLLLLGLLAIPSLRGRSVH